MRIRTGTDIIEISKYYKKVGEVTLSGSTIFNVVNIENKKEFIDLSGYVWEDMLNGKDNARNNLFQNDQYDDKDKLVPGVKVIFHNIFLLVLLILHPFLLEYLDLPMLHIYMYVDIHLHLIQILLHHYLPPRLLVLLNIILSLYS